MFWTKSIFKKKRDPVDHAGEIDPKYVESARFAFRERKRVIDEWIDNYHNEYRAVQQPILDALVKEKEHNNSVCPKCGSKNIVNNFIKKKFNVFKYNHFKGASIMYKRSEMVLAVFYELINGKRITIKEIQATLMCSRNTAYLIISDIELFIADFFYYNLEIVKEGKYIYFK